MSDKITDDLGRELRATCVPIEDYDALRAEAERMRAAMKTAVEVLDAYPYPMYEIVARQAYNGLRDDLVAILSAL